MICTEHSIEILFSEKGTVMRAFLVVTKSQVTGDLRRHIAHVISML